MLAIYLRRRAKMRREIVLLTSEIIREESDRWGNFSKGETVV